MYVMYVVRQLIERLPVAFPFICNSIITEMWLFICHVYVCDCLSQTAVKAWRLGNNKIPTTTCIIFTIS